MDIARLWRQQPSNLRLEGSVCTACEAKLFPERIRCPECGSDAIQPHPFKRMGTLLAHTTVYEAKQGFADQVPFVAGLVQIDDGPVLPAMVADVNSDNVAVGMRLEMVTRKIRCDDEDSPILYGYKFAPADDPQ